MTSTVCFGLLLVFFCQPQEKPVDLRSYCAIYRPIKVSRTDNQRTIRAVVRENRKWKRLCAGKVNTRQQNWR